MENKMKTKLLLTILFVAQITYAQNQIPVVGNVHFSQRIDGSFMVDIYYDVNDYDGANTIVTMKVSDDGGATWNFSATKVTGDVGHGIPDGTNKHIVWDFGAEHANTLSNDVRIKILADDGILGLSFNPCPGLPTVVFAGKTYNTVQIFDQCWLKENLDVGAMIQANDNMFKNSLFEKYCYDNEPSNCEIYGGLYQWNEAMRYVTEAGTQGICPPGWRIPTFGDIAIIRDTVNAVYGNMNALKEVGQGSGAGAGTNNTGFSALLAGLANGGGSSFGSLDEVALFWTSTKNNTSPPTALLLYGVADHSVRTSYPENWGLTIRCIKAQEISGSNLPPNIPSNPIPSSDTTNVLLPPTLGWSSSDPDGDNVFFDVYLGTSSNPELAKSNYFSNSYTPTQLIKNTTYYWKVVVKDGQAETEGPVWSFTTDTTTTVDGEPCPSTPTVTYAGTTYNTIQIGDQCWLKENLNVGVRIPTSSVSSNNGTIEKYCYNNDETNCDIYGGLYSWNEAMEYLIQEGAQGICPDGWHIPTTTEFGNLSSIVFGDGNALKEIGQGSGDGAGTDLVGFSVLLAGRYWGDNFFSQLSSRTYLWSSNETTSNRAFYSSLNGDNKSIYNSSMQRDDDGLSIRCLKD